MTEKDKLANDLEELYHWLRFISMYGGYMGDSEDYERRAGAVKKAISMVKPPALTVRDEHPSSRVIGYFHGICPTCNRLIGARKEDGNTSYCRYCGQLLWWSLSEEAGE